MKSMTNLRAVLLSLALVGTLSGTAHAKSGPPIPRPAVELGQALSLSKAELVKGEGLMDVALAKPSEYLPLRIELKKDKETWRWEVLFAHPIHNDHTALYAVGMDKTVWLLKVTE